MIKACGFLNCLKRKDYKYEVNNSEEIDIENLKKKFFATCKNGCLKDFLKHNQLDNDIWKILLTSKESEGFGFRN